MPKHPKPPPPATGKDPADPAEALPDFLQRAAYQFGPFAAARLLLLWPWLAEVIPGDDDSSALGTAVVGAVLWLASYAWRWRTSRLSRPPVPEAVAYHTDSLDAMLALAAAASQEEREADADQASRFGAGTAVEEHLTTGAYDTARDLEP